MQKDPAGPSNSTPDSESGRKKKSIVPHFNMLISSEIRGGFAAHSSLEEYWQPDLEL